MATALISDIHGNLEALRVVLDDIKARRIKDIICLGDIVGYGPNPIECLDLVIEHSRLTLMGNHDFAVVYEPTEFSPKAIGAIYWTREQLEAEPDQRKRLTRWNFLVRMKYRVHTLDGMWAHASPRRPIFEYIFPADVYEAPTKLDHIFKTFANRCFVGHTHVAGVFEETPAFRASAELRNGVYKFKAGKKYIVNPGSVGQPRDRDPRASYAILHDNRVEFVRKEYDIQAVIDKIKSVDPINDFLGTRLLEGR